MFAIQPDDTLSSISVGIDELAAEELRHVDGADLIRTWKERCRLDAEFTRRFAVFEKRDGFTADGALSGVPERLISPPIPHTTAKDRPHAARREASREPPRRAAARSRAGTSSARATSAHAWRETACARSLVRRPAPHDGKRG